MITLQDKVYNYVADRIAAGAYQPGDRLPTELELARTLKVNRANVHRALKRLEVDGVARRNKREGTFLLDGALAKIEEKRHLTSNRVYALISRRDRDRVYWADVFLNGFERGLAEKGYQVVYREIAKTREALRERLDEIVRHGGRALALLALSSEWADFFFDNQRHIARFPGEIYILNRGQLPMTRFPWHEIAFDPYREGFMAADYALGRGYEKLLFLGHAPHYWTRERSQGAADAVRASENPLLSYRPFLLEDMSNVDAVIDALRAAAEKVCVITQHDSTGAEFLDAAKKKGLVSPKDFGLVTFSDAPSYRGYNMTTFVPDHRKLGRLLATAIIANQYRLGDGARLRLSVSAELLKRETC